ncbi:hypothetical protein BGZ73_001608 [Actinomortierella ambigua]|nr:hypothetical protein BGZ73_001608 [Actinomortierella ambigua]
MKITQPVLLLSTSLASALLVLSSTTSYAHASPVGHSAPAAAVRRRESAPPLFGSTALFADDDVPHAAQLAQPPKDKQKFKKASTSRLSKRSDKDSAVKAQPSQQQNQPQQSQDSTFTTPLAAARRRRRSDHRAPETLQASASSTSARLANTPSNLRKRALSSAGDEVKGTREDDASSDATHKGSAPRVARAQSSNPPAASSSSSSSRNASLILLPNPKTVWQAGSTQTVKWSRKYAGQLPADTTVDIVLVDARTNRKMYSLKRFIPFTKGSTSVWVPAKIQEGISYVLVLELYRGRSQDQVSVESRLASSAGTGGNGAPSTYGPPRTGAAAETETSPTVQEEKAHDAQQQQQPSPPSSLPSQQQPQNSASEKRTILRRSEINIAHGSRKVPRGSDPRSSSSSSNSNSNSNNINNGNLWNRLPYGRQRSSQQQQKQEDQQRSSEHDSASLYASPWDRRDHHPLEFMPDEMRREFPGIDPPLDIEHTFGVHQIVVTKSPYTIRWKVPQRVADWLEKAELWQKAWNAGSAYNNVADTGIESSRASIQAKVKVDVIRDQTLEVASTLARNIPAQTMFMYLQVDDRLPIANYRLRVQMLVVEVMSPSTNKASGLDDARDPTLLQPDEMPPQDEGWDFPPNSRVIDRYETITRRFQVVAGAL